MRTKMSNTYYSFIQLLKKTASDNDKIRAVFRPPSNLMINQLTQNLNDNDALISAINKRIGHFEGENK